MIGLFVLFVLIWYVCLVLMLYVFFVVVVCISIFGNVYSVEYWI